jgi:hypothetical protein
MNIKTRLATLIFATALTACAHVSTGTKQPAKAPPPLAELSFQFNQQVTLELLNEDPALTEAFLKWAKDGVYANTPVYRQLPGIFVLTGKPRLKGTAFIAGTNPTPDPKGKPARDATMGYAGLVIHADGTVGPEIVLTYGRCFRAYCEGPANIRFAKIGDGQGSLGAVQRGDNLMNIAIQPR